MRSITRLAAGGFLAASTMLGLTLASGPAMAQGCTTGSSCQEGASVTVQTTITETLSSPGSFTFGLGNPVPAGNTVGPVQANPSNQSCAPGQVDQGPPSAATLLCPDFSATVSTGDGNGYTEQISAADLTNGKGGTIGASALSTAYLNGNNQANHGFTALSNTPATLFTTAAPSASGGDVWPFADSLVIPSSANGTYQTEIQLSAIAN